MPGPIGSQNISARASMFDDAKRLSPPEDR
jgi:hypothetical protein